MLASSRPVSMGGYAQMMAGIPRSMPGNQENAPARMVTSYVFFTSFRLCPKLGIEFILPVTAKSSNPRSNDFRHTKIMAGGACFHLFYNFSTLKFGCSTCLAVAGDDFCIVAADSRLSVGYSILSRTTPKASQLTQHCVIASSGCNSDQVLMEPLPNLYSCSEQ